MTVPATIAFAVNSVNGWNIVNPLTYAPEKDECHLMKINNLIDCFKFCFLNKAGCARRPGFVMSFNEDSLLEEEQFTSNSHPESNRFVDFVDVMNIMLDSSKRLDDRLDTLKRTLKTRKDHADRLESRGTTVIEGSDGIRDLGQPRRVIAPVWSYIWQKVYLQFTVVRNRKRTGGSPMSNMQGDLQLL
ncbi:hypothetical protein ElyMa_005003200 [Elysia marginata]|uniref:Uncharacterized protein n=1 Tax=Elysia marginata TaxID=1093978 RepID=A0AAV4J8F5_9GAST|nr:hypothetical protein ElyMa_005003200 [Elysia marginata]